MRLGSLVAVAAAAALLATSHGHAASKKGKPLDMIWLHPEFATLGVDRIAVLPVATFDNSLEAEQMVEQAFGQVFRKTGYRWISPSSTRDLLRERANGTDSLVKVLKAKLLKGDRVDSLEARILCAWVHAGSVLSLRVDQWEREAFPAKSARADTASPDSR